MQLAVGTIFALYYGAYIAIFLIINKAPHYSPSWKLALALPSILFLNLFPYILESDSSLPKFLLMVVGFFSTFSIVDLIYLDPINQLSFRDFMFSLTTSSRPFPPTTQDTLGMHNYYFFLLLNCVDFNTLSFSFFV
jgi:hypothetical protein